MNTQLTQGGAGTLGQGNDGGTYGANLPSASAGGGGASTAGGDAGSNGTGGTGGDGVASPLATAVFIGELIGSDRWIGGGGGGQGAAGAGIGGRGGGGSGYAGGGRFAQSGSPNTGGGAGAGPTGGENGAPGGSGVVVLAYSTSDMTSTGLSAAAKDGDGSTLTAQVHGAMTYWVFRTVGDQGSFTIS